LEHSFTTLHITHLRYLAWETFITWKWVSVKPCTSCWSERALGAMTTEE